MIEINTVVLPQPAPLQQFCSSAPQTQAIATDAVPSFPGIAVMPCTTSISIQTFLRSSYDVMPNLRLTEPKIDDVDAYILSQRARPPGYVPA